MAGEPVYFENSQPILRVADMNAALHFYVDLLGFTKAPWGDDGFTAISRDRAEFPDGNVLRFGSEPLATEPFAEPNV